MKMKVFLGSASKDVGSDMDNLSQCTVSSPICELDFGSNSTGKLWN